ncbi:MAG: 7TM-DISM domain-containing protein [Pseudomonadota bacterium]|nr:7TM-DISM domain-containing protein [Pseudomonadota bacterium]
MLWLVLGLVTASGSWAAVPEAVAVGRVAELRLPADSVRFKVQSPDTEFQSPLQLPADGWQRLARRSINVGKQRGPVWFHFRVANQTAAEVQRLLEIRWINLRMVEFFAINRVTGRVDTQVEGLGFPKPDHSLSNTSWIFPFQVEAGATVDIYIRAQSRYNVMLPMFVWQPEALQDHQVERYVWYGLAFGVLADMLLYNLSLYVFTRDSSYLFYSVYAASIIVYEFGLTGVGDRLVWGAALAPVERFCSVHLP